MRELLLNFIYITISKNAARLIAAIVGIIIARELGPKDYGTYIYILTIFGLVNVISNYGFVEEYRRQSSLRKKYLFNIKPFIKGKSFAILLSASIFYLYFFILRPDSNFFVITFLSIGVILRGFENLFVVPLQVLNKMKKIALISIFLFSFFLVLTLSLKYVYSLNLLNVAVIILTMGMLTVMVFYKNLINRLITNTNTKLEYSDNRIHHFGLTSITQFLSLNLILLLIEDYYGNSTLGEFSAAFRIITISILIPQSISFILIPKMYKSASVNNFDISKLNLSLAIFLATLISYIYLYFGKEIINLLFSEEYLASIYYLKYLSPFLILNGISHALQDYLITTNQQKYRLYINLIHIFIFTIFFYLNIFQDQKLNIILVFLLSEIIRITILISYSKPLFGQGNKSINTLSLGSFFLIGLVYLFDLTPFIFFGVILVSLALQAISIKMNL
jgi:O-antigen/teichoic acid export membrane protein